MGNIVTYAEEYRHKSFKEVPFNTIDALVLSQIAYFDYSDSTFTEEYFTVPLWEFYKEHSNIILKGMLTVRGDEQLIEMLKAGGRHGGLRACCYVDEVDEEGGKQFSAITFEMDEDETGEKIYYIAFRGTDNTVVGWKEDLTMSYLKEIPAQNSAAKYAAEIMEKFSGKFYIGGHSKGGNLAIYAAMSLPENQQKRVNKVYNFDGPGFLREIYMKPAYQKIREKICKIVPQSSVIGMMLEEDNHLQVIYSTADALLQHDPYTWVIHDKEFEIKESVDALSKLVKRCLDGWLDELPMEERKRIVDTVFDVIFSIGISGFYEVTEQRFEKIKVLFESLANVDTEEKKRVQTAVKRLLIIAAEELHKAAKEESTVQFAKSAVLLERRAVQVERFLRSIQRQDKEDVKK